MINEANPGEFTLVYNGDGIAHPVGLTKEQHQMLQILLIALPGKLLVVKKLEVRTERVVSGKANLESFFESNQNEYDDPEDAFIH